MRLPCVRFTLRRWLAVIFVLAVLMAAYMYFIEGPARRRRYFHADRAVTIQIDLLRRAAEQERHRGQAEMERAARIRGLAEKDEPARATLWAKAADEAYRAAEVATQTADQYQKAAADLAVRRLKAGDEFAAVVRMGGVASTWLAEDSARIFPPELRPARATSRVEHEARAGGRSVFSTVAGPRVSVIEATAIWQAEQHVKATHPAINLNGFQVKTTRLSLDQPFVWVVSFTDPRTRQTHECKRASYHSIARAKSSTRSLWKQRNGG